MPIMVTPYRHNWLISGAHRNTDKDACEADSVDDSSLQIRVVKLQVKQEDSHAAQVYSCGFVQGRNV
eukprot:5850204-Amphidinium_carterae.1